MKIFRIIYLCNLFYKCLCLQFWPKKIETEIVAGLRYTRLGYTLLEYTGIKHTLKFAQGPYRIACILYSCTQIVMEQTIRFL